MAVQLRSWIANFINTYIIPNGNNLITGQQAQDLLVAMNDSLLNRVDDKDLLNLREWKSTRAYDQDECCVYQGCIYESTTNGYINNQPDISPFHWSKLTEGNSYKYSFPPYDNAVLYAVDDTVRYQDRLWRAVAATQGNAPTSPSPYWIEVSASTGNFGEPWAAYTIYAQGHVVRYNGWLYEFVSASSLLSISLDSELTAGGIWQPLPNVEQVTRAQFLTKKNNNRLVAGRKYFLTDIGVFLTALTPNRTEEYTYAIFNNPDFQNANGAFLGVWTDVLSATANKYSVRDNIVYKNLTGTNTATPPNTDTTNWVAVTVASDPTAYVQELCLCRYHVAENKFSYRKDSRNNEIESLEALINTGWTYSSLDNFQWGDARILECSGRYIDTRNNRGDIMHMRLQGSMSSVDCRNNAGIINNIKILDGGWKINRDGGQTIQSCYFNRMSGHIINPSVTYQNLCIDENDSNYLIELDITGRTSIDWSIEISNLGGKGVGVVKFKSSNSTEAINSMYNFDAFTGKIRIVVDVALTVSITDSTIKYKNGATGITLNGANGDWVEFGEPSYMKTVFGSTSPHGGAYELNSGIY